jgi:hypothetical protein
VQKYSSAGVFDAVQVQHDSRKSLELIEVLRGEPSGTRTRDPVIKSHMLYRPELTAHKQ